MDTSNEFGRDGSVGLGVLLLMTVAFIAGEAQTDWRGAAIDIAESPDALETHLLIDLGQPSRSEEIAGAIRELSVVPVDIHSRLDLNWSADDVLIEEHRQAGF